MASDSLLTYPSFNENFKVHTNARNLELGAVILQKRKPTSFYSRKRAKSQQRYTVTEWELLRILETMK